MCLTIYCKTRQEARDIKNNPKVAEKDIVVWKRLYKDLTSPLQYYQYERNTHYYQVRRKFGFKIYIELMWKLEIHIGLHSFKTKEKADNRCWGDATFQFIIPKGSLYYENENEAEIVSDQLIFY